jgi:hypothetical protein
MAIQPTCAVRIFRIAFIALIIFIDTRTADVQQRAEAQQSTSQRNESQAKNPGSHQTEEIDRPPKQGATDTLVDLIAASRTVPSELHAHALLLLVESNLIPKRESKLKLAFEAFDSAAGAALIVKKQNALLVTRTDSTAGLSMTANSSRMDRLSLQSRALADIDALDPATARALLQGMKLPELSPVGCGQALVYDLSSYYALMKRLAQNKRGNIKGSQDATEDLLYPSLINLQTHTQVPQAVALLNSSSLTGDRLEVLTQAFVGQLENLKGDERGFEAEMLNVSPVAEARRLYGALESQIPGSGSALLREYRKYLIDNYRAGGCGKLWTESIISSTSSGLTMRFHDRSAPDSSGEHTLPKPIEEFNRSFRDGLSSAGLSPISFDDIYVNSPKAEAENHEFWQDSKSKLLLKEAQALRFTDGEDRSLENLRSSEWRTQAIHFLGEVDDWGADPFSSAEVFYEKMTLYSSVIDLAPENDVRRLAIEGCLKLIEDSGMERENPGIWLEGMRNLRFKATHQLNSEMNSQNYDKKSNPEFTQRLIKSTNSSTRLIGMLETANIDPFSLGPLAK